MIILEFDEWKSDSYTRDYAHRMLRKSGSKMSLNGPDAEDLIYQINTAKSLGISEKELLRILAASNHPDDMGKILRDLKGLTRRYADMYHTDRSIPLNRRKRVNEEKNINNVYTELVTKGSETISKFKSENKENSTTIETDYFPTTYFSLGNKEDKLLGRTVVHINYQPDFDDSEQGWFVIQGCTQFKDNSQTKMINRSADNIDKATKALKELVSKLSRVYK